jgi:hypothetical protein
MPHHHSPRRKPLSKGDVILVAYPFGAVAGHYFCRMPDKRRHNVHSETHGWDFVSRERIFLATPEDARNAL